MPKKEKTPVKKTVTKKAAAIKTPVKKTVTKKAAAIKTPVKKTVTKKAAAIKTPVKKTVSSFERELESALKDTLKKIQKFDKRLNNYEKQFSQMNSSLINIEKIASRMKDTTDSQNLISKKFEIYEKNIDLIKKETSSDAFFKPISQFVESEIRSINKKFNTDLDKVFSELQKIDSKMKERALKLDELFQNIASYGLEAKINSNEMKDVEAKLSQHTNQLENQQLQFSYIKEIIDEKISLYDQSVNDINLNKNKIEDLRSIPEELQNVQTFINNLELQFKDERNSKKRLENRLIQFESSIKNMTQIFQNESKKNTLLESNFTVLNKKITELSSNFNQEKEDLLENFRQRTILDEKLARRQIDELRDELKVTRQFLNKLTQKGNVDGQGKML
ncbi:MAG: hypothetical protein ACJ0J6_01115 [Dehalococcoidia bacterium]